MKDAKAFSYEQHIAEFGHGSTVELTSSEMYKNTDCV